MRAISIPHPREVRLVEMEIPKPSEDEVLVEVVACGLCTTDLEIVSGDFWASYPAVPGHEIAGVIREVGGNVLHVNIGDRVALDPNIACGWCSPCRNGAIHMCENLEALGVSRPGGFAEYLVAPGRNTYALPDRVEFAVGALAEPLACVLHGLDRVTPRENESVNIFGAGFIGLLFAAVLRHLGIQDLLLVDPVKIRRKLSEQRGLRTAHPEELRDRQRGRSSLPSICIVSSGNPEAVQLAIEQAGYGARVLIFGVARPSERVIFSPYEIFTKELSIIGSFINPLTMSRSVELLSQLDLDSLISETFELGEFEEAVVNFVPTPRILKRMCAP